jgi:hypothetical protein
LHSISERVDKIFRKRGAYSRYKDLLDYRGVLQKWYDFENQRQQSALLRWFRENDIEVNGGGTEVPPPDV